MACTPDDEQHRPVYERILPTLTTSRFNYGCHSTGRVEFGQERTAVSTNPTIQARASQALAEIY